MSANLWRIAWNLRDRAAEGRALGGVLERAVEALLGAGHAARRADQALALELPHDVVEALALLAQQRVGGHAHVLEGEQRGVRRVHAELLELLLADHPGRVHVDQEQREAVVARVGVGLGHEHDEVGAVPVGDVGLRAVDHPLVAVAHRARLDAGHVGPGVGLGDPQAGDLLAPDRRHQVALLLLLAAEQEDRRGGHVGVHRHAHRQAAGVAVRHLLGEHEVGVVVAALAAVLLGVGEAEEAQLAHAPEDRVGERGLLPLLGVRRQLLGHERPDRLAQLVVLLAEDEVLAAAGVIGLEQRVGGGHGGKLAEPRGKVNSDTSYFPL